MLAERPSSGSEDRNNSQEREHLLQYFFETASSTADDGFMVRGSDLRGQTMITLINRESDTHFHVIKSVNSDGITEIHLTWQSDVDIFPEDNGTLNMSRSPLDDKITVHGSVGYDRMPADMFSRLGFRWAAVYERNSQTQPIPISDTQIGDLCYRFIRSYTDIVIAEASAHRQTILNVMNNPKTSALEKSRVYNIALSHNLLNETELQTFAPKGYMEMNSTFFQILLRIQRLKEAAKTALLLAGLQAANQAKKEIGHTSNHDAGHHNH